MSAEDWSWLPPRAAKDQSVNPHFSIPAEIGKLLSVEEVEAILKKSGAEDIVSIALDPPLDSIETFVIATGTSRLQLRRMGETFVKALKQRKLDAPGANGYEGEPNDDWVLIDCRNMVIHLLMPNTRKALNLEGHWGSSDDSKRERPFIVECKNDKIYEKRFERLLDQHGVPEEYYENWDENEEGSTPLGDSAVGVR
jgi:ribosome silencing factor RsfS/YbeB/iojap